MKKEFVRLQNLLDLTYEGDTFEAKASWENNVMTSVGSEGYTFAGIDDLDVAEFACDEMEFADVSVYDFMGSEYEQERFYARDIVTFKHKATGEFYVLNKDDLMEF
jgi:hypothetical protein